MKDVKRQLEKFLSVIITFSMIMVMVPISVHADSFSIDYIDADGTLHESKTCTAIDATTTIWGEEGNETWYALTDSDVTINSRVTVQGDVHLVLTDNYTLNIPRGIRVAEGNSFTVYAQSASDAMGRLIADNVEPLNAGLGGDFKESNGTITVNGGMVQAEHPAKWTPDEGGGSGIGGGSGANSTGAIIINGGKVVAKGCNGCGQVSGRTGGGGGAGIGGGGGDGGAWVLQEVNGHDGGSSIGPITITGGQVIACGGAGAGAGDAAGNSAGNGCAIGGGGGGARAVTNGIKGADGSSGTFTTNTTNGVGQITSYGNAVIIASSIGNKEGEATDWSGVIFEGNNGKVYTAGGKHPTVTPTASFEVSNEATLEIPGEATLIIPYGIILTNSGTINNAGTLFIGESVCLTGANGQLRSSVSTAKYLVASTFQINVPSLNYNGTDQIGAARSGISLKNFSSEQVEIMEKTFMPTKNETGWGDPIITNETGEAVIKDAKETYTVKYTFGAKTLEQQFSVERAELTVKVSVNNKTYEEGNTSATIEVAELEGTIYVDDKVSLQKPYPEATFANAGPGDDIDVNFGEFMLDGARAFNYCLTPPSGIKANIIDTNGALKAIEEALNKKLDEINNSNLTDEEKETLINKATDIATAAKDAINDAKSNAAVEDAKNAGVDAINKIEVPSTLPETPTDPEPVDPEPTNPDNGSGNGSGNSSGNAPNPDKGTSTSPSGEQSDPKDSWGELIYHGGIPHYVSADGTTSVEVTGNGMIWLKEESDGTSAWYGLDNSSGEFAIGSRFHVHWLSKKSDPDEWGKYYAQLDKEHKDAVENDNLWIFLIGVTHSNGTEYTKFSRSVPLYIQLGDDWGKNDINAVFISNAEDEVLDATYSDGVVCPEGTDTFAKLTLDHFSPYAIYDKLTEAKKAVEVSSSNTKSTGDIASEYLTSFLLTTILLATAYILIKREKRSE